MLATPLESRRLKTRLGVLVLSYQLLSCYSISFFRTFPDTMSLYLPHTRKACRWHFLSSKFSWLLVGPHIVMVLTKGSYAEFLSAEGGRRRARGYMDGNLRPMSEASRSKMLAFSTSDDPIQWLCAIKGCGGIKSSSKSFSCSRSMMEHWFGKPHRC